jgi:hypothetical protein
MSASGSDASQETLSFSSGSHRRYQPFFRASLWVRALLAGGTAPIQQIRFCSPACSHPLEVFRNRSMDDEIIESPGGREQVLHGIISSSRGCLNSRRSIGGRETTGNISRYSPEFQFGLFVFRAGLVKIGTEDLFDLVVMKHFLESPKCTDSDLRASTNF